MRIVYTDKDGHTFVVHAAAKSDIEKVLGPLTDEQYKTHVWERSIPSDAVNAMEIADDYQLPNREFRNAWSYDGKEISHNMGKAKQIQLERIRFNRDLLLAKYDGLQSKASDMNDADALIDLKVKKQQLRDATNQLKSLDAVTIEEVKAATPDLSGY